MIFSLPSNPPFLPGKVFSFNSILLFVTFTLSVISVVVCQVSTTDLSPAPKCQEEAKYILEYPWQQFCVSSIIQCNEVDVKMEKSFLVNELEKMHLQLH